MDEKTIRLDEINLHGLIVYVVRNLWIVVLLCISALLCYTSACRLTYQPVYTSTTTFMVSAKDSTSAYNSLTTTQSMASVFAEVFQSNVLREKIQEELPNKEFDGTINTTMIPETNLLIVTVTSGEPALSFRALNLLIDNYSTISDYLFSNAQLEVIKDPIIPVVPSNPLNVKDKYPMILLGAGAVSLGGIVLLYLLRDTVKTPKAAQRQIEARLLRTIGSEEKNKSLRAKHKRKNIAPLISNALISKRFIEENMSLCSALEYHARKRGQQVILVTSVGENEGKSTVASNLALAMAEKNRRVVLLDCDFRKPSLYKIFETQIEDGKDFNSYLLKNEQGYEDYLLDLKKHGITVGFSKNSGKGITQLLNNGKLREVIEDLRTKADYIIIDSSPMLAAADAETIAAMADTAVLVVRADFMPVPLINEGLERLKKSAPEVCGFVMNHYHTDIL